MLVSSGANIKATGFREPLPNVSQVLRKNVSYDSPEVFIFLVLIRRSPGL